MLKFACFNIYINTLGHSALFWKLKQNYDGNLVQGSPQRAAKLHFKKDIFS